jgi:hypothetical protein
VLARWTGLAEPTSKVVGAGGFQNRWTRYGTSGGAELLGFFAVGDAQVETNPVYGRGCSSAFVQAHALREALDASHDARERTRRYCETAREQLSTHFDFCLTTDRMSQSRAKLKRAEAIALPDRTLSYLFDAAFVPAMNQSALVAREMLKAMQMRPISSLGVRLRMVAAILVAWCSSVLGRRTQEEPLGPPRAELLTRISVPSAAAQEEP